MITIIGAGLNPGHISAEAKEALSNASRVVLQTKRSYISGWLDERNITYECFDGLYDSAENFDALNRSIAKTLCEMGDAVYVMPSSPQGMRVTDEIARECEKSGVRVQVIPSISCAVAVLCAAISFCDVHNAQVMYAHALTRVDTDRPLVVCEMDNQFIASQVKLELMEYYPDDTTVYFATLTDGRYILTAVDLCELDRQDAYDHMTCVFLGALKEEKRRRWGTDELLRIIQKLRAPDGCPWDSVQTYESLRSQILEEAYEVAEAVDLEDEYKLSEELGDLLMVMFLYVSIGAERGSFTLRDVTSEVCQKLIFRHPHVFGSQTADTPEQVEANWETLKREEKKQDTTTDAMRSVCAALPALVRAKKVQKKAARDGFDWDGPMQALAKVREETEEVERELKNGSAENVESEIGDLLFSTVNVARLAHVDSERALEQTIKRFVDRYEKMEEMAQTQGGRLAELKLAELNVLWEIAKQTARY